ncbi:hypothetical protein [Azospirillum brasilense]|uniref:hypothetical protein n=1 Tax=Azospirillum brasilense TaxID=192 RepID=UPI001FFF8094|nr:hypothetical protein [Azospirillum brasilense]
MPSAAMWLEDWLDGLASRSGGKRFNFIVALRAALDSALRPRTVCRVARAIPQTGTRTPHVTLVGAGPAKRSSIWSVSESACR